MLKLVHVSNNAFKQGLKDFSWNLRYNVQMIYFLNAKVNICSSLNYNWMVKSAWYFWRNVDSLTLCKMSFHWNYNIKKQKQPQLTGFTVEDSFQSMQWHCMGHQSAMKRFLYLNLW